VVAVLVSGGGAGVLAGTRRAFTPSSQPSWLQVPSHVSRPGFERASVVCPAAQVPRTRTPWLLLGVLTRVSSPVGPGAHASEQHYTSDAKAQVTP